jgi:hypothetical protein
MNQPDSQNCSTTGYGKQSTWTLQSGRIVHTLSVSVAGSGHPLRYVHLELML